MRVWKGRLNSETMRARTGGRRVELGAEGSVRVITGWALIQRRCTD